MCTACKKCSCRNYYASGALVAKTAQNLTWMHRFQQLHGILLVLDVGHPEHEALLFLALNSKAVAQAILPLPKIDDAVGRMILAPAMSLPVFEVANIIRPVRICFSATAIRKVFGKLARKLPPVMPGLNAKTMPLADSVVITSVRAQSNTPVEFNLLGRLKCFIFRFCVKERLCFDLGGPGLSCGLFASSQPFHMILCPGTTNQVTRSCTQLRHILPYGKANINRDRNRPGVTTSDSILTSP